MGSISNLRITLAEVVGRLYPRFSSNTSIRSLTLKGGQSTVHIVKLLLFNMKSGECLLLEWLALTQGWQFSENFGYNFEIQVLKAVKCAILNILTYFFCSDYQSIWTAIEGLNTYIIPFRQFLRLKHQITLNRSFCTG